MPRKYTIRDGGPPPLIVEGPNLITVKGVAVVQGRPVRANICALRLAERIAAAPAEYLSMIAGLKVPGVVDLRPSFGRVVAHG